MGSKRNNKLLVIIMIVVIILILLIGISILYFTTDIWKGNKQLFFQYASQLVDEENGLIHSNLIHYFEKQKNTPYKTDGSISLNMTPSEEQYEYLNDMNITFSGQVDVANSKSEQNISINYSEDITFPFIYRQIGDTIGFQSEYVGSKFVSTSNLGKLLSGNSTTMELDQFQNLKNFSFREEELKQLQDMYLSALSEQLKESNFSRVEENNTTGYKLTITLEDCKNILLALVQTLKNDPTTLEKLNEFMQNQEDARSITTSDLDRIIESLENTQIDPEENSKLDIIIYQKNKKLTSIEVKVNDVSLLKCNRMVEGNSEQYLISIQMDTMKIEFLAQYAGLETLQKVSENYELSIELGDILTLTTEDTSQSYTMKYNFRNQVSFSDGVSIEDFNQDNNLDLDSLEEEQRNTLLQAIMQRIQMVNEQQMRELGVEEGENPLQYVLPMPMRTSSEILGDDKMDELEITQFNSQFEVYGGNVRGTTVKGLLTIIATNNELEYDEYDEYEEEEENTTLFSTPARNKNLIEEIHFDGSEYEVNQQNITLIKSSIEIESFYRVEFEKEEDTGRIYRVVINKK